MVSNVSSYKDVVMNDVKDLIGLTIHQYITAASNQHLKLLGPWTLVRDVLRHHSPLSSAEAYTSDAKLLHIFGRNAAPFLLYCASEAFLGWVRNTGPQNWAQAPNVGQPQNFTVLDDVKRYWSSCRITVLMNMNDGGGASVNIFV